MIMVAPASEMVTPLHQSRVVTLFLEGELDRADLAQVGQELLRIRSRGQTQVVLDLADVAHLDYRGIRGLCANVMAFREMGGDIKVAGASPYLLAIFRASGAGQTFEFYRTLQQAQSAFLPA